MKLKLFLSSIVVMALCFSASAQSPFKRLPTASHGAKLRLSATENTITAWRFSAPVVGYDVVNKTVGAGVAYGFEKDHYVDSTGKWYTDYSIKLLAIAQGSVVPNETNIANASFGIRIGALNDLVGIAPVVDTRGRFGLYINFSAALH